LIWSLIKVLLLSSAATAATAPPGDPLPSPDWRLQELRPTRADQSFLPDPAADPWSGGLLLSTRLPLAQDVFWEYWNWPR